MSKRFAKIRSSLIMGSVLTAVGSSAVWANAAAAGNRAGAYQAGSDIALIGTAGVSGTVGAAIAAVTGNESGTADTADTCDASGTADAGGGGAADTSVIVPAIVENPADGAGEASKPSSADLMDVIEFSEDASDTDVLLNDCSVEEVARVAEEAAREAAEAEAREAKEAAGYAKMGVAEVSDYVNIRDEASESGEIVGTLDSGCVATVESESDGWYEVSSGSVSGYIKEEYLTVGDRDLIESVSKKVAKVTTETLKVRAEASTDAPVVELASEDDNLSLKEDGESADGWIKVKVGDEEGYVSEEYVDICNTFSYAKEYTAPEESESGSGGSGSVASYALQFVGNPYVWGGTSLTNGADCSGFVMSVYAHFGISLPHSSYSLRSVGYGVSYSEAQPGDIICYDGHVAIYIGGGEIVHAANSRSGIKVSNATYRSILAVRRVM